MDIEPKELMRIAVAQSTRRAKRARAKLERNDLTPKQLRYLAVTLVSEAMRLNIAYQYSKQLSESEIYARADGELLQ